MIVDSLPSSSEITVFSVDFRTETFWTWFYTTVHCYIDNDFTGACKIKFHYAAGCTWYQYDVDISFEVSTGRYYRVNPLNI